MCTDADWGGMIAQDQDAHRAEAGHPLEDRSYHQVVEILDSLDFTG